MGVVFRARSADGRTVALKLLLKLDGDALVRFDRERRLLASLGEADGFVPLIDWGDSPDGPYLVMPLVEGGTLRDRIEKGPLGIDETIALGQKLARALGKAHERGIVHRDLKPENVLFTFRGGESDRDAHPLIADLGLAKHFDPTAVGASRTADLSREGSFRGTLGYAPAELMRDAMSAGPPADVFALGAVLQECLTGKVAFDGETAVELINNVANDVRVPVARARPDTPAWLAEVLERSLARLPAHRYPDGLAFARALAGPAEPAPRGRGLPEAVLAALLLAVLGGGLLGWANRKPPAPPPPQPPAAPPHPAPPNVAPVSTRSPASLAADTFVEQARAAFARGDDRETIDECSRAIALDPGIARAWLFRGSAKAKLGRLDQAIDDLTKSIDLDPQGAAAWLTRANVRERRGDGEERTLADARQGTAAAPQSAHGWATRAVLEQRFGRTEDALASIEKSLALDSKAAGAHHLKGLLLAEQHQPVPAITEIAQALSLDARLADAWYDLGCLYVKVEADASAAQAFEKFLSLDPDSPDAPRAAEYLRQARARLAAGDALEEANAHFEKRDMDGAIAACTRGIELDPDMAELYVTRAGAHERKGEHAAALADCEKALELDPKLVPALVNHAIVKERTGDAKAALADYGRALEINPKYARGWYNRGIVRDETGDTPGAIEDFKKYVELAPVASDTAIVQSKIAALEKKVAPH
jgi:tetratricopeptide (TPR) repeat protein